MIITFQEILGRKEWLHKELLNSLTYDLMIKAQNDQYYEVKLLVNDVELEPVLFNEIMNNVEKVIDTEARNLISKKMEEANNKSRRLQELINEAIEKIRDEFELANNDD